MYGKINMILIDVHETPDLDKFIGNRVPHSRHPLNTDGLADMYWWGVGGSYQFEHKCVNEILDNQDSVELQLQNQYPNAHRSGLIVRDVASPSPRGNTTVYKAGVKGGFKSSWKGTSTYYKYCSWIEAIRNTGIIVIEVPTLKAVADRIVAFYNLTQRVDHTTLQRYIQPHITIPTKNPHILALMGVSQAFGLGIGAAKAANLIAAFDTVYNVINATEEELCKVEGIGGLIAGKLGMLRNPKATKPVRRGTTLSVVLYKDGA